MRFYKPLLAAVLFASLPVMAMSDDSKDKTKESEQDFLMQLNGKSKDFIKHAREQGWLDNYKPEDVKKLVKQYEEEAKNIASDAIPIVEKELKQKLVSAVKGLPFFGVDREADRIIFISFSMSRGQIRSALKEAKRVNARVLIKGFIKGTTHITETTNRLMALVEGEQPAIQIDPTEFKKWAVTKVPVIAYYDGERSIRAAGVINFDWLDREINGLPESTKLYAFGEQGEVRPVVEIDLIEMMKDKLSEYDFEKRRKETWDNYWARSYNAKLDLPKAEKTETWYIDPTVKVLEDITTPEGTVLAQKGQVMNPLTDIHAPFKYLVFNPNDKEQVAWAKQKLKDNITIGNVKLMVTHIDAAGGWKAYQDLKKEMNWHIFQVPEVLVERFMLSGVPVEIGEHNGLFKITQEALISDEAVTEQKGE